MTRVLSAVGLAVVLLAAACGSEEGDLPSDTRAPVVSDLTVPTTTPPTIAAPTDVTSLDGIEVATEEVAQLDEPIVMATRPGEPDRVYIGERAGRVLDLSLADGSSDVILDITDDTTTESERGLLGLAVAPDGAFLYVSHTNPEGDSRVEAYAIEDDGTLDEGSKRVVFALDQPFPNHNGGNIVFGPDGFLYLGFGDGGDSGDPLLNGQDRGALLGSILRIDPRGTGGSAYTIPSDNPFVGEEGARPEVWLKGVRNPWRFSFDRTQPEDLWIGDVGQEEVEEVDFLPGDGDTVGGRGANLGWNEMEGDVPFEDGVEPDDATPPIFTYTNTGAGGCSVTGGYVYRGASLPLFGAYLFTDYCHGRLTALAVDHDTGEVLDEAVVLPEALTAPISFGEDTDGELYVMTQPGQLLRIVRNS